MDKRVLLVQGLLSDVSKLWAGNRLACRGLVAWSNSIGPGTLMPRYVRSIDTARPVHGTGACMSDTADDLE